jgi:glycosyltransferase involved in cell wall biosynthesis
MPEAEPSNRKRVLFLHPNFPAQFKHLAGAAAASGHDVRFLCQTHYNRTIPGVTRLTLKGACSHEQLLAQGGDILQRSTTLSEQYRQGFAKLRESGWQPDIVISHSGWGCGLYIREFWPTCRYIAYLEWWFDPESDFFHYDPNNLELGINPDRSQKLWLRNQSLALELIIADAIVAPTRWQASQLPRLLKERCHIIHDGIDLSQFKARPELKKSETPIITYGTRGMEPMRAFPQFIRSLPAVLERHHGLTVQIAGQDSINYGGSLPEGFQSWGNWAKHHLSQHAVGDRVHWLGYLDQERYVKWLQSSDCHIHLSHPFVASWSLLEALACQCPMVVSDVAPVRELCNETRSAVTYVDHRDIEALSTAISDRLRAGNNHQGRSTKPALDRYSRVSTLQEWSHVACVQLTTNH